jgi:hypothetical protein
MSDGGKGSSPRPFSIANDEYSKRWDAIFCRDLKEEEDQKIEDEAFESVKLKNSEVDKTTRYNDETQAIKNISR